MSDERVIVSEAGHWYDRDGSPRYTVPKASSRTRCPACTGLRPHRDTCVVCDPDGWVYPERRDTTLKDAKTFDWCRGVTTIIRQKASFALEAYKMRQFAEAAWTAPKDIADLDFEAWYKRVSTDAAEHAKQARDVGTAIHAALELSLGGYDTAGNPYHRWVEEFYSACRVKWGHVPDFVPEKSFTSELGYGCKIDALAPGIVADFKTKDFKKGLVVGDEIAMQLAANRVASGERTAQCFAIFIDRETPSVKIIEVDEKSLDRGWRMFVTCLQLQRLSDNWWPAWATEDLSDV